MFYLAESCFIGALVAAVSSFALMVMVSAATVARALFTTFLCIALFFLVGAIFFLTISAVA
jgi:hypothetical protein